MTTDDALINLIGAAAAPMTNRLGEKHAQVTKKNIKKLFSRKIIMRNFTVVFTRMCGKWAI